MSDAAPHQTVTGILSVLMICLAASPVLSQEADGSNSGQCGGYDAPTFPEFIPSAAAEGVSPVATSLGAVLPDAPKAAMGMYTTDVDMLIWLGYPLAKRQPIRGDNGYADFPCFFPQAPLADIEPFPSFPEYNYEQMLLAEPDFILSGLGYDTTVNERLPQIAPTYSVNAFDGRSWQEHFKKTATALGRLNRYEAWEAIYQARVEEVRALIAPNAAAVVTPLSEWNGTYYAGCAARIQCIVFEDVGLTVFSGALENDRKGIEMSPEQLGVMSDVDFVFTTIGIGEAALAAHESQLAEAAKNPVWAKLRFVEQNHIVPFELDMVYGSPSGQLAFLEVIAKSLSK